MSKKHPKGLIAASLSNMGERFGFYTMMAILVLFLMSKFGLSGETAGTIYATFYFSIYILALAGGVIADRTKKYKSTIQTGIILMAVGYLILAVPTVTPVSNLTVSLGTACLGLFLIAFGNGLFKGNLQALVGQMYDNPQYSKMRDAGFSLFYMFINVGAIFAPLMAIAARNLCLKVNGFGYDQDLPALCHQYLDGTISADGLENITKLSSQVSLNGAPTNLATFASEYLNVFNTGYHYAFGIAIVAMLISLTIYMINKKNFPDPALAAQAKEAAAAGLTDEDKAKLKMDVKEVKQRLYALFAVFAVVIFFWFSFHQNGLTLTFFAQQYTDLSWLKIPLGVVEIQGAEIFQSVNPLFVVLLTPVIMGLFGWMRAKGIEPSTPKKIGIGMGIAACAYIIMTIGSLSLPPAAEVREMGGLAQEMRVTPFLLFGTYIVLTIAELFISPLGISFVSKVAPPQYQGIMQGCWLGATAIGNQLLFIGGILYYSIPLWMTWTVFVVACLLSMTVMFSMLKWLERVAK